MSVKKAVIDVYKRQEMENPSEVKIRDAKDRPILRAALNAHVDLLLTGDKDFLESAISVPRIVSVMAFLDA